MLPVKSQLIITCSILRIKEGTIFPIIKIKSKIKVFKIHRILSNSNMKRPNNYNTPAATYNI